MGKIVGDKITELENRPNHQKLCQIHGMPNSSIIPFIGDALHVAYEGRVTGDVFIFRNMRAPKYFMTSTHSPQNMKQNTILCSIMAL